MTDYCRYCDCRNCRSVRANEKMRAWVVSRETKTPADEDREAEELARAVGALNDTMARCGIL